MKTYNQFLNTSFSEEVKPEPPPESEVEDSDIQSKEKRQKQIKKMVLLKKLQAVRAGAGADIVAGYEPEGEMVDETYFDSNTRGVSTKGGLVRQYNKPGKLSQSSLSNERKSKDPKQRMSKKEMRKSMEDDANYEKKMGRSKPTPSNLKTALKKQSANEATDKAFEYVKKQIAAKYGKSGYVSKDNPRKPQTAAEKKKVAAHKAKLAKQDHRDPTEKASDGRYSDRYSNRGSD